MCENSVLYSCPKFILRWNIWQIQLPHIIPVFNAHFIKALLIDIMCIVSPFIYLFLLKLSDFIKGYALLRGRSARFDLDLRRAGDWAAVFVKSFIGLKETENRLSTSKINIKVHCIVVFHCIIWTCSLWITDRTFHVPETVVLATESPERSFTRHVGAFYRNSYNCTSSSLTVLYTFKQLTCAETDDWCQVFARCWWFRYFCSNSDLLQESTKM